MPDRYDRVQPFCLGVNGRGAWGLREEEGFDVEPVVDAAEAGDVDVGGRGEEDAFAAGGFGVGGGGGVWGGSGWVVGGLEEAELAGVVVDEEVGAEDGFVAAEDDVGGGDEREVLGEPMEFGGEAGGDFHGGGGDEDVVAGLETGEDAGGVGHDGEDAEEVVGAHVGFEGGEAGGRDGVPEPAAVEVGEGEWGGGGEVAIVAEEVLGEGVGDDLVHVDGDDGAGVAGGHEAVLLSRLEAGAGAEAVGLGPVPVLRWAFSRLAAVRRSPGAQRTGASRRGSK